MKQWNSVKNSGEWLSEKALSTQDRRWTKDKKKKTDIFLKSLLSSDAERWENMWTEESK